MSRLSARFMSTLADLLRRCWWASVSGFSVIGGSLYGGAPVAAAWQRYADPRFDVPAETDRSDTALDAEHDRPCPVGDDVVQREVTRGLAELERFLAAHRDIPRGGDRP